MIATFDKKICEPLTFAPVEVVLGNKTSWSGLHQAQRCPRCKVLVAVGISYDDHIFWCKRADGVQP
jgi:hypothetical protein